MTVNEGQRGDHQIVDFSLQQEEEVVEKDLFEENGTVFHLSECQRKQ